MARFFRLQTLGQRLAQRLHPNPGLSSHHPQGHTPSSKTPHILRRGAKLVAALALVLVLVLGSGSPALAASRGGRLGGGSFRSAPSRTYRAPSTRSYSPGPVSPYGGGMGFNPFFFIPFFGFGGGFGGLFGLMLMVAIGGFVVRSIQQVMGGGESSEEGGSNPSVSVAKVQVGLSSQARELQDRLNRMALSANTDTSAGLAQVLQETTLGLLRHPEYWCYGAVQSYQGRLDDGEARFNRFLLEERSKLSGESLANVRGQVQRNEVSPSVAPSLEQELAMADNRSYLVVTLLVGMQGKVKLPSVTSEADLKQAIETLGAIGSEQLLSLEVLWAPQDQAETLTADDLLAYYPNLTVV